MKRISKKTIENYKWASAYIRKEYEDDRHILACLGSAGLTFVEDIERFLDWCWDNNYQDLCKAMNYSKKP